MPFGSEPFNSIEKQMAKLEAKLETPFNPALYIDKPVQELNKGVKAQGEGKNELQTLEEEWLGLQDELEAMTAGFSGSLRARVLAL